MKSSRRMATLALCLALMLGILAGCGGEAPGISLRVSMGPEADSYDPIRAETPEAETVLVHLYENLLRLTPDPSGGTALAPGVAKKYDVEENYDGTVTYTFRLRAAKWSDGQAVTAGDFVYAWQRLADPVTASPSASRLSAVAGDDEVRSSGAASTLEVSAPPAKQTYRRRNRAAPEPSIGPPTPRSWSPTAPIPPAAGRRAS